MGNIDLYIFLFIIPGILGNVSHMFIVKMDLIPQLAKPLSVRLFGSNKTWRGFVVLPLAMGLIYTIESFFVGPFTGSWKNDFLICLGLGLAYMLSELPNSFNKRKLGIAPGESGKKNKTLQLAIDKADSLSGACLFLGITLKLPVLEILILFLICLVLHIGISYLLFKLKLKKSI